MLIAKCSNRKSMISFNIHLRGTLIEGSKMSRQIKMFLDWSLLVFESFVCKTVGMFSVSVFVFFFFRLCTIEGTF